MKNYYFSLIMPVYDSKETLDKAILSILNQSYDKFELIIVDDHSTDGSYEISKKYTNKYKNIRLIRMEKNFGAPHCMNIGVKNSKYIWVGIIDSDAIEPKNWLEIVTDNMQEGIDVIGGKCSYERDECKSYFKKVYYFIETHPKSLKNEIYDKKNYKEPKIMGSNFFFKKEVFNKNNGFDENIRAGYDRLFLCEAIENGYRVNYVSNLFMYHPLYNYKRIFDIFKRSYMFGTWRVLMIKKSRLMGRVYSKLNYALLIMLLVFMFSILLLGIVKTLWLSFISLIILFLLSTFYLNKKMSIPYIYTFGVVFVEIIKKLIGICVYYFKLKPTGVDWKKR